MLFGFYRFSSDGSSDLRPQALSQQGFLIPSPRALQRTRSWARPASFEAASVLCLCFTLSSLEIMAKDLLVDLHKAVEFGSDFAFR